MINEEINNEILALWKSTYCDGEEVWIPSIYPPVKKESILFIGLNPSFSERGFRTILTGSEFSSIQPKNFYRWESGSKISFKTAIGIEKLAREKYPYFDKFKNIAKGLNLDWEHIDLFFYRETNQKELKKIIFSKGEINEFGRKQLEISKKLLKSIKPKIIVVANAFASKLFYEELNLKLHFDEDLGCHITELNGQLVPVFMASMLTGQRAMDNYSFERLKWHIKRVYKLRSE